LQRPREPESCPIGMIRSLFSDNKLEPIRHEGVTANVEKDNVYVTDGNARDGDNGLSINRL